jgi:hypothetical protein
LVIYIKKESWSSRERWTEDEKLEAYIIQLCIA